LFGVEQALGSIFQRCGHVQAIDPHVVTLSFFDFEGHGI
jgi:hypothetical protein